MGGKIEKARNESIAFGPQKFNKALYTKGLVPFD
jgi:hypothetical protein